MTDHDCEDDASTSSPSLPVATKLDTAFKRHDTHSAARSAAESPLPPSPTKPSAHTQPTDIQTQDASLTEANISVPAASTNPGPPDDFSQVTPSPLAQTQLSNLKKTQNSIVQQYFSSAPLNPRNNKTTDSAGAHTK